VANSHHRSKRHRRSGRRGRGRSRKRRPAPGAARDAVLDGTGEADHKAREAEADQKKAVVARARTHTRGSAEFRDPLSVGERPPAPWHPWPLSEMLILVGGVGTVVGLTRLGHGGIANGGPVLFAGLGAVVLGTLEVTLREHRAGYRSHTLILAFLPVLLLDTAIVLAVSAFTTVPRLFDVGVLAVSGALFAVLFKLLRARFLDARARVVSRR
jgi:hypothetical protein